MPRSAMSSCSLVFVAVTAMPSTAAAQIVSCSTPPAVAVAAIEQRYRGVTTFSSDFTQTFFAKAYQLTATSKGHVVFSRPANMDWTFTDPAGTRIVSDGVQLTIYDAPLARAFVQPVSQSLSAYPVALAFLGALSTTHTAFQLLCGATMQFPGGAVLVAEPAAPTPAYTKVLFYIDAASGEVRRVWVLDGLGNRNRFDFFATKLNEPVATTQFVFTPPAGVTTIQLSPTAPPPPPVPVLH